MNLRNKRYSNIEKKLIFLFLQFFFYYCYVRVILNCKFKNFTNCIFFQSEENFMKFDIDYFEYFS